MKKESFLPARSTALGMVLLTIVVAGCWKPTNSESPSAGSNAPPAASSNPIPEANPTLLKASADLQKLKGRWLRPDGGYILEIKQVDAQGKMDAAYFNPNPISVTNAVARLEGDDIKLLVELSGENYPGSRYELTYISAAGLMTGTYYQALLKQTFDVVFERAR